MPGKAEKALDKLAAVVESGENYLPGLTRGGGSLFVRPNHRRACRKLVGRFRPMVVTGSLRRADAV